MTMQVTQAEATMALIRHFDEVAFNAHDLDAIMGDMTEDTVFECLGPAAFSGRWEGQTAVRAVFEAILGEFPVWTAVGVSALAFPGQMLEIKVVAVAS